MRIGGGVLARRDGAEVGLAFWAIVLAMLPAVLDQTILATALPTIASQLGRLADVSWVVTAYVVAAAVTAPLWGKLGDRRGRKLVLEFSLGMFLAHVGHLRLRRQPVGAGRGPKRPGRGRGRVDVAGPGCGGRSGLAARARALPGLHHGRVRRGRGGRATARRTAGRPRELAVGVLCEPADWRGCAGGAAPAPARRRWPAGPGPARPAGRRSAGHRDGCPYARVHLGRPTLRLGLAADPGAHGRLRGRDPAAGYPRPAHARSDRAAQPDRQPAGGAGQCGAVPSHGDDVLDHGVRAAVPADDDRREPDPGRPAADPDDGRSHALDQPGRPCDPANRSLQGVSGDRSGADRRRADRSGRAGRASLAVHHGRSPSCCTGWVSGWSARC